MTTALLEELRALESQRCECDPGYYAGPDEDCEPPSTCMRCGRMAEIEDELESMEPVCPFCGNADLEEGNLCLRCHEHVVPVERREF